jgi:hypothetical protein
MTSRWVNKSGNDSNTGLSPALAKLTIGGAISASASNDVIIVQTGVYSESLSTSVAKTYVADGMVILDGEGAISTLSLTIRVEGADVGFEGFIVRRFNGTSAITFTPSASTATVQSCRFEDNIGHGATAGGSFTAQWRNCVFVNNNTGLNVTAGSDARSCTFADNNIGAAGPGGGFTLTLQNCIFRNNTTHISKGVGSYGISSNGNLIDFSTGNCISGGTHTTLAAWQAAVGSPRDDSSISSDPKFLDENKRMYGLKADSPCLFSGLLSVADRVQGAFNRKIGGGGAAVMEGFSSNRNPSIWNGAVLVNTLQNASGNYIMSSGTTEGSTVFTAVFASGINIGKIFVNEGIYYPLAVIDHDNTDSVPNRLTLRARFSPDIVPTYGPYVNFEPGTDVAQSGIRQMEITAPFRKNGVSA